VDAGLQQADLVREALTDDAVEVRSVLCFVEADWPLLGSDFMVRNVTVTWPKKLAATITRPGPLTEAHIAAVNGRLATAFPPAGADLLHPLRQRLSGRSHGVEGAP
jgi:hypothetical protein